MRITPTGRLSFPNLYEPSQIQGEGEKKYSCTLVFEPNEPGLAEIRAAVQECMLKKWNKQPPNWKDPFIDGSTTDRPEYHGKIVLRLSSKEGKRPQIVDRLKQPITNPEYVYSGCHVRVSYNPYAWSYMGKNGVSLGLGHVQKIREDHRFDGRGTADTVFEELSEDDEPEFYQSAELGTPYGDDDVPF